MKKIYLVRHGLINYQTYQLNKHGTSFANILSQKIDTSKLVLISSDTIERCIETVKPLAKETSLPIHRITKTDFELEDILSKCPDTKYALYCYRIETINSILRNLDLPLFTSKNRNSAYEIIWEIDLNRTNEIIHSKKIPTGYSKNRI